MITEKVNTFYYMPHIPHKTHNSAFTEDGSFILKLSLLREKAVIKYLTKITNGKISGHTSKLKVFMKTSLWPGSISFTKDMDKVQT